MKNLTIGRGRDCNIHIDDKADLISRRHATITFSPMGKMTIYDTSANGTFVNEKPVEKPNGTPLKRGDKVDFAHVATLDWKKVKDPYLLWRIFAVVVLAAVVAAAVLFFVFADRFVKKEAVVLDKPITEEVTMIDSTESVDNAEIKLQSGKTVKRNGNKRKGTESKNEVDSVGDSGNGNAKGSPKSEQPKIQGGTHAPITRDDMRKL